MEISLCLSLCIIFFLVQISIASSFVNYKNMSMNNNNNNNIHLCRQDQSHLLLQLKQQHPPYAPNRYYRTKYWKEGSDCCHWDGVTCEDFTGHVIALDLSLSRLSGHLNSNSSLFHLTHLRSLNLAYNDFTGSTIPSKFGRLNALTHLNLSRANFEGEIPMEFYHLSNLVSLDLSTWMFSFIPDEDYPTLRCDVKMLLGNMTRLRVLLLYYQHAVSELPMNMSSFLTHLDLENTRLQGELPATIFEKPNLQILKLGSNGGLKGSLPKTLNWSNVRSLEELDLSGTSISGKLPDSIGFMTSLNSIHFSGCRFSGPIPESIRNISTITSMVWSNNEFSGRLPDAFSGFQNLKVLDLSYNNLEGRIPPSLTNMSQLMLLDISSNALTGPFPSKAGHGLQELSTMDFSNNSIQGTMPPWVISLPSLHRLDLSSNNLTGRIGKFNSQNLKSLDLSSNRLNIELESFYNLTNLYSLKISFNTVTEHDGEDTANVTFPNLKWLEMSSCEIKELPNLLWSNMPSLNYLNLSSNGLNIKFESFYNLTNLESLEISFNTVTVTEHDGDDIVNVTFPHLTVLKMSSCKMNGWPNFSGSNMPSLNNLDLSINQIHSPVPNWFSSNPPQGLSYLNLHSNSLWGTFPSCFCNMSGLSILNLADNKLSGNIPECLANSSRGLQVLDLRTNEFHGKIPATIGALQYLANLGLNGNQLEGTLPPSLANCTALEVIDLGNNMFQDTFPWWLHTLPNLKILILKSNSFHGSITSPAFTDNSFTSLQILDLSYNNFTGILSEKLFASLQAIKHQNQTSPYDGLYMGGNRYGGYEISVTLSVKGESVELIKVLKIFTTIDLSSNNFNSSIPDSLSNLTSLRLLNLSHNSIHGSIPPTLGRMTNLEQLDLSRNQLMGGIPQTLTSLTFLAALNLSHNHLVGPIPQSAQFSTFSNDSFAGNSGLCGAPLTRICGNERESPSPGEEDDDEEEEEPGFTWKEVVIGYGCGILLGFFLGNVMISMEKPRWLARFVYVEAQIILRRRNNKRRTMQGRRS